MARSPFKRLKPLTPRQRKKGLVLPMSESEAVVLRAILGPMSDYSARRSIEAEKVYPNAVAALDADGAQRVTYNLFARIHRACERRGLAR